MTELVPHSDEIVTAVSLLAHTPPPRGAADPYLAYKDSLDSPESKTTMMRCLDRIALMIIEAEIDGPLPRDHPPVTGAGRSWWLLRYEHTSRIRGLLLEMGWSPSNVNKHLSALRRVLQECKYLGLMTADEYDAAARIKNVDAKREKAGRSLNPDELSSMLRASVDVDGPSGVRNAALIGILWCTGARREEVANIVLERYNAGARALRIIGKGNKERTVYIHPRVLPHLDAWLALLGTRRGPMFRPIDRWGHVRPDAMSKRAIGMVVARVRARAGLPPLSTHDFRHTFIGDLLDKGVDLATVQALVGHASPVTTAAYDRRPELVKREAVDSLDFPGAHSATPPLDADTEE
ncbi:tyrosine-type recombinase/integrase [Spirillospora sp. NBC_01491]|uniref:tyrosine-type recombinase/integrase n=1 Tax=Spirillospora sp. NBC_01491 TaxID=2976007 RepID=UPI002E322D01|nr:site-specific integrase [Spirillospora sp. NBC_01491]